MSSPIRVYSAMTCVPGIYKLYRQWIATHLKGLPIEDRYLRFCSTLKDEAIDNYVSKINFSDDGVIIIFDEKLDENLNMIVNGFLHASPLDDQDIEFGISVSPTQRNKGNASALFSSAVVFAKARGYKNIYMNCLYENKVMRHIVTKYGFDIDSDFQEVTAKLKIDSDKMIENSIIETMNNNLAIFDLAYRSKIQQAKEWFDHFK